MISGWESENTYRLSLKRTRFKPFDFNCPFTFLKRSLLKRFWWNLQLAPLWTYPHSTSLWKHVTNINNRWLVLKYQEMVQWNIESSFTKPSQSHNKNGCKRKRIVVPRHAKVSEQPSSPDLEWKQRWVSGWPINTSISVRLSCRYFLLV